MKKLVQTVDNYKSSTDEDGQDESSFENDRDAKKISNYDQE